MKQKWTVLFVQVFCDDDVELIKTYCLRSKILEKLYAAQ